jgi:GTPase Era involved in 16S rRNA processing
MATPVFVVVGAVNRGKSSIVSTLAENDTVAIDPHPGTTRDPQSFTFTLDGQPLYTLIDTPGFEHARQVLDWLRKHAPQHADRATVVRQFVRQHGNRGEFAQECKLLQPILDGGAILYVVDSSLPFSPSHKAEMEILQWTMQPRMALLNRIHEDDYTREWRKELDQYFNVKLEFNALKVDWRHRIKLLQTLIILHHEWQQPLEHAIRAILNEYRSRMRDSAMFIAQALVEMLTLQLECDVPADEPLDAHKQAVKRQYDDRLRELEADCFRKIRQTYAHWHLHVAHDTFPTVEEDLLETSHWKLLDIQQRWAITGGAAAGALIGGTIDASVGGASFLLGTAIGTGIGGLAGWIGSYKLPQVSVEVPTPFGGTLELRPFRKAQPHHHYKKLRIGPMHNPLFPYVVLSRALRYHHLILTRPHALREQLTLSLTVAEQEDSTWLTPQHKVTVDACVRNVAAAPDAACAELAQTIQEMIEAYEGFHADTTLVV